MALLTEQDVAHGLRNREFILYYQPKASLISNRIVGVEALARWQRPDRNILPPAAFIPLAERSHLIKALTLQLLPQLIHDLVDGALGTDLDVSFNVSASDFEDDTLTSAILEALGNHKLAPASLELEITETQALHAGDPVLRQIRTLAEAGVGLAMDDYGIGYSSMDTLSQWPFTTIKLDQGIVGRMLSSDKNATIVRSSIRLGHELGIKVIAEGVEQIEQHDFLVEAGCKLAQGYLISPPLPLDAFKRFRQQVADCRGFPIGLVHMAIVDHVQWRRRMVSYAIRHAALPATAPARQSASFPPLCVTACALGQWYYGDGRYFADTRMYQELDTPHRRLHRIGEAIVEQVRNGAGVDDVAALLSELRSVSQELIQLLAEIEDIGLQTFYGNAMRPC